MTIIPKYSTVSTTKRVGRNIDWIVVHYDAGTTSKPGTAESLAAWFAAGSNKNNPTSSDYIIDDAAVVQYNGDIYNRYTWGVGGAKYPSMSTSIGGRFYGAATNQNVINIEVKSNKINTKRLDATDKDWYFTDAAINNLVELVKYLMELYHIDVDHVIMHHEVTGKLCPAMWTHNESELAGWYAFKSKLTVSNDIKPTAEESKLYYVVQQLGAYRSRENAEKALDKCKKQYPTKIFKII